MAHDVEASVRRNRWSVTSQGSFLWENWDEDEFVVYSTASGDTHLINGVTAEVLRQLERRDLEFSQLVLNLAESFGAELDQQTESYVARLLVHLDEIGLVDAVP